MTLTTNEIINEVNSLPVEDRAIIADSILRSLNTPEKNIKKKWIKTAKRRLDEIKSKKVKTIDGESVFREIWDKYKGLY